MSTETKSLLTSNQPIATEFVKLPSKGKLYPVGHPLYDKEEVEFHYMCGTEEDLLTSPALLKRNLVFTNILKSCLMDKTIDPDSLLIPDRTAILTALRATSYGNMYKVGLNCDNADCNSEFEYEFDLNKLPYKFINEADIQFPFENKFKFILPKSKKEVLFKILTAADDAEIDVNDERMKKMLPNVITEKRITGRLIYEIISIDGVTNKTEIANYITAPFPNGIHAFDSLSLRKRIKEVRPGLIMEQEASCPKCGDNRVFSVPMSPEFFWPSS